MYVEVFNLVRTNTIKADCLNTTGDFVAGPGSYEQIIFPGCKVLGVRTNGTYNIVELETERGCCCPMCQTYTTHIHDSVDRFMQDTCDAFGKPIRVHLKCFRFKCYNSDCPVKVFRQPLQFAEPYDRRTNRVNASVLSYSIETSYRSGARELNGLGIKISHDTVRNYGKSIKEVHSEEPEEIGVDDVCTRKGCQYDTVVYDAKTYAPLALLEGRDGAELAVFLQKHRLIRIAMRDRSSDFSTTLTRVLGSSCIQVADKFHLLQNIINHLKQLLKDNGFNVEVWVDSFTEDGTPHVIILPKEPKKIYAYNTIPEDILGNVPEYTCDPPLNPDGSLVEYNFSATIPSKKQIDNKKANQKLARKVKAYFSIHSNKKIKLAKAARELGTTPYYVKLYMNMSDEEIENLSSPKCRTKEEPVHPHMHMIYKMLRDNIKPYVIFSYIKYRVGFDGTDSALQNHINAIIANNFPKIKRLDLRYYKTGYHPDNIRHYTTNDFVKYALTVNPKTKKDKYISCMIEEIKNTYPLLADVQTCMKKFYDALNGGDPSALDTFINEYSELLPGFCHGLKLDYDAVINSIITKRTSGFVEGNNTTFKYVKRMGYGRYKTPCLRIKFTLFLCRKYKNFNLFEIVRTKKIDVSYCAKDGVLVA